MAESNVQATGTGVFSKRALMGRFFRAWNSSILAHPVIRRLMRFAVLKHPGRRSGRVYATPVSARPTATGFVVPLTFGEKAEWYRNALDTDSYDGGSPDLLMKNAHASPSG